LEGCEGCSWDGGQDVEADFVAEGAETEVEVFQWHYEGLWSQLVLKFV